MTRGLFDIDVDIRFGVKKESFDVEFGDTGSNRCGYSEIKVSKSVLTPS